MGNEIDVFNDGKSFVKLIDWVGDELSIVNAARVSFHNESQWEWDISNTDYDQPGTGPYLSKKDKGLIKFLLKNKHGSPFEQGFMAQFHIRLPIFVMREWVRHRVGFSINEESGRYVEMRGDFYLPQKARIQHGKPGAYTFEELDEEKELSVLMSGLIFSNSEDCFHLYKQMVDNGIAKEQARLVLPLNLYTEIRWTCNARSLMNFLALRNAPDSMFEIREYARVLEEIFSEKMPNVYKSFVNNGRIAP